MSAPISKYQYSNPTFRNLGYFTWGILALFSIVFYKERAAFMDGAFQLVNLINTGEFSVHHYRLTNPLTQLFAWIGIKTGMSLKAIMIGYSLNFIVFQVFLYTLIVRWCKNDFLGLVQVGFFTLFVTQSFYFVTPEFYQGMSILLLWTAILLRSEFKKKIWYYPILMALLIPIIFDHTLLSAFFLLIWIFLALHDRTIIDKGYIGLLLWMIVIYVIHDLYFTSWYDEARKGHFWRHWNEYYPNFHNIPGHQIFAIRCLDTYYFFPILLILIISNYARDLILKVKHKYFYALKLCLVFGFCFCYLMLNHINDPNTPFLFYSQVNYIGLSIPLMMAIVFDILPKWSKHSYTGYIIGGILILRLSTIAYSSQALTERHQWMLTSISNANAKKVYVHGGHTPKELLLQTWASSEETLLLTSLKGREHSASLLIKRSDYKYNAYLDSTQYLLRAHSFQILEDLNKNYFDLGNKKYVFEDVKVSE